MSPPTPPPERIRIRLDDDRQAAWLTVAAGSALAREAVGEALAAHGIVAGLDAAEIDRVVEALSGEAEAAEEFCIARGRPAIDATSDRIELALPIGPIAGRVGPDERFDYRERQLIVPVRAGEAIGQLVAGDPGEPGFDVLGREIAPRPAPAFRLTHGEGVTLDETGRLLAAREGARTVDRHGALDVVALFVHSGSVDLESGNLETRGSLQIGRDVTNGMIVRVGADLAIKGTVEAARLEAGGSIEIGGGVIGAETGCVRAAADLKLRHALSARLHAGEALEVTRDVLSSELHAKAIKVGGTMIGGQAFAESSIEVRDAGSPAGGLCVLRAARPLETGKEASADERDARERARALLRGGPDRLSARKGRDTRKGRGERPDAVAAPALAPQLQFRKRQHELQPSARIEIKGTAHAGCRIDFGGRPLLLDRPVRGKVFRFDVERDEIVAEEK
jgi:uncharacterized protein (DUF342 family)